MESIDIENLAKKIEEFMPQENIFTNEPMKLHTSFKIGGNADIFVKIKTEKQATNLIEFARKENVPLKIIGNGSNLLVKDEGIRGITAKVCINEYRFLDETTVKVDSGMLNSKLAQILLNKELQGFEFAANIPGTIGGAVKMNAGAYGGQMSDIVLSTTYMDLNDEKIKTIDKNLHKFGYRSSVFFEKNVIILNTTLKLNKSNKKLIQETMEKNNQSRREKQPIDKPSAGSTFKRGTDFITAKLIDECGLKGYSIGGASVSEKHAGFIVNNGNATASDVLALIAEVKKQVKEKFNKEIELEIEIV